MNQEYFEFDSTEPEPEPPYVAHSETSRAAAESIEPDAATLRGKVLALLRQRRHQGATDEEMQAVLRMNPSTQRPRRIELCNADLVMDSNRHRNTRSGRRAVVWIAREFAQ